MTNLTIARRHAPSLVIPTLGGPLIRSVPELGWQKVRIKATIPVDADMPLAKRKRYLHRMAQQFIREEERLRGARFAGNIELSGPRAHLDARPPDTQVGDRGGTRPKARNLFADSSDNGKEAYDIWGSFWVREEIQEVRTDVAESLFQEGASGIRPMRERDYRWLQK